MLARAEAAAAINEVDDPEVLRRMADTALTVNDLHGDSRMDRLRQAVGGALGALHAAIAETAAEMGLTRIGGDPKDGPDQLVTFDRRLHDSISGSLRPGQKVLLVAPGYAMSQDGAVLIKAKVEEADPDEIRRLTRP